MIPRTPVRQVVLFALTLGCALQAPAALEPVVVAGADVGLISNAESSGAATTTGIATPRVSISWRESLGGVGYVALEGRGLLDVPLATPAELSDGERIAGELGIWVGEDEFVLRMGLDASFLARGVSRVRLVPAWSADYRFTNETGRFALQTDGSFRYDDGAADDRLTQRLGVGFIYTESIRLQFAGDLLAGYELWPEYPIVNSAGAVVDDERSDLTLQAGGELSGLVGYFTSWQLSALVLGRRSNATRFASGSFESDTESGVTARLGSTLRTTPTRALGLSGSFAASHRSYAGRPARDADGAAIASSLGVTSVELGGVVDLSLLENLFLVGSLDAGLDLSADPAYRGWSTQVRIGAEYSF
ncbi:MAG: hypothetical protein ACOC1U_07725 [Spirochaetota bacterium]